LRAQRVVGGCRQSYKEAVTVGTAIQESCDMKVDDIGHGAIAIKTDSPADYVASLSKEQLKQRKVSSEAIDIYLNYIDETSKPKAG
jgi:hypothetical protein